MVNLLMKKELKNKKQLKKSSAIKKYLIYLINFMYL
jgi:hypothetical protein